MSILNKIKDVYVKIDNIIDWEPNTIFGWEETRHNMHDYKVGTVLVETDFGKKIEELPFFFEMGFKLIYYLLTWPPMIILKIMWWIITSTFIPQKWQ